MERLGEAGMKQKADELEKAIEQNEVHSHTQFRRKTMTACSGKISDNGVNSLASTNILQALHSLRISMGRIVIDPILCVCSSCKHTHTCTHIHRHLLLLFECTVSSWPIRLQLPVMSSAAFQYPVQTAFLSTHWLPWATTNQRNSCRGCLSMASCRYTASHSSSKSTTSTLPLWR